MWYIIGMRRQKTILSRIEALEKRVRELEQDVEQLEATILPPPSPVLDLTAELFTTNPLLIDGKVIQMATVVLTWTDPTTRVDGSALDPTLIASLDIFDSGSATPAVAIGNVAGPATTFTTGVLSVGDHGFTVVVNDNTGHVSAPSNVAAVTVKPVLAAPSAVTNLTAVLTA